MPYSIDFDEDFEHFGLEAQIYSGWFANEASNGRIYRENNSVILQNLGTFTPSLKFHFAPDEVYNSLLLVLGAKKNGSGNRPSTLELILWKDEAQLYRTIVGPVENFENKSTSAVPYLVHIEPAIFMQGNVLELRSIRGEGSGTSAGIILEHFAIDDTPPPLTIANFRMITEHILALQFSSPIALPTANASEFTVNEDVAAATYHLTDNDRTLNIAFHQPLSMFTEAILHLPVITSTDGTQTMAKASHPFTVVPKLFSDVIYINEVLLQPVAGESKPPQTGIPQAAEAQFIELYNNSDWDIQTDFLTLNQQRLPKLNWKKNSYLLLANPRWQNHYQQFGNTLALPDLPVPPKAGTIYLSFNNVVLDSLHYNEHIYGNVVKSSGGWSLERKTSTDCQEHFNWAASVAPAGATPGRKNSLYSNQLHYSLPVPGVDIISPSQVALKFDAAISHFDLNDDNSPKVERIDYINDKTIRISFQEPLAIGKPYTLRFNAKLRCFDHFEPAQEVHFGLGDVPKFGEVVINEIYHNPQDNPTFPEQFVELYNTGNSVIDVSHLYLASHRQTVQLPVIQLMPGAFLTLSPSALSSYGENKISMSPWPTMNTSDGYIAIKNVFGEVLHEVDFNRNWYRHHIKSQGAYALEMIDSNYPCTGAANWRASEHAAGATPGSNNSVKAANPDIKLFSLSHAIAYDAQAIALTFNKPLHPEMINRFQFVLSPPVEVADVFLQSSKTNVLILQLESPLTQGEIYQLKIHETISCHGDKYASEAPLSVSMCQPAEPGDIVVNEVLSHPAEGSEKFIEIMNISDKYINLKDWLLARIIDETPQQHAKLSIDNIAIAPGQVLAFTENAEAVRNSYPHSAVAANIIELTGIPNFPQRSGNIGLYDATLQEIDQFAYDDAMHHPMLSATQGVSLERASGIGESAVWVSAPATIGFASPGATNANQTFLPESYESMVMISPKVFNPSSSILNMAHIQVSLPDHGYAASIAIYTKQGRLVKTLCQQANVAQEAAFIWYGDMESGGFASIGEYIVLAEFIHPSGEKLQTKKIVAISPQR